MSALLPMAPPASMSVRLLSSKNQLTPAFGDGEQELLRKGSRYEITFDMGEMDYVDALEWSDLMTEGQTVVMAVYQPGLPSSSCELTLVTERTSKASVSCTSAAVSVRPAQC